jgi:hypothetical protein
VRHSAAASRAQLAGDVGGPDAHQFDGARADVTTAAQRTYHET